MVDNLEQIVKESFSINDLCVKIYGYCNGRTIKKVIDILFENKFDVSHFGKGKKLIKNKRIIKICPVCEKEFETIENKKEKTTCSHGCSNSYFQHGKKI